LNESNINKQGFFYDFYLILLLFSAFAGFSPLNANLYIEEDTSDAAIFLNTCFNTEIEKAR